LDVDSLLKLESNKPSDNEDPRLLMKQMQQLSRLVKILSLILLGLSLIYMYTRIVSYKDMRRALALSALNYVYVNRFEHIEELHYFLLGHSGACVLISVFAFLTVNKSYVIDRRQYFIMLGVSTFVTVSYFFALAYVVLSGSKHFLQGSLKDTPRSQLLNFLEGVLELLQSISRNQFSFFFAVIMNFALLYGIFVINMCSVYLVEIAKKLEQRRTGGRDKNEVELSVNNSKRAPGSSDLEEEESLKINIDGAG
jgi:hypothetical protein